MDSSRSYIKLGLALFLTLLLYDGAIRRWFFPEAEHILFVAKDFVLFSLAIYYWSLLFTGGRANTFPGVQNALFLYTGWAALEIFNPSLPNIMVGIWGLKTHILYITIFLLVPLAFSGLDDCFRVIKRIYPVCVIPVILVALLQIASPSDAIINKSIKDWDATAFLGESELVRVTGTFSYISGMASFVQACLILGFGIFLLGRLSSMFAFAFVLLVVCIPATGSRALMAISVFSILIMCIFAYASGMLRLRRLVLVVLSLTFIIVISIVLQTDVWLAMQERALTSRYDEDRFFTAFTNAFEFFGNAGLLGFGTGSTNLGGVYFVDDIEPFSWLPSVDYFEEESGRIVLELGVVGWLFSISFRALLLIWCLVLMFHGRTSNIRLAALISLPVMAVGLYIGNGVFLAPVGACFYWFCVGMLSIAQSEQTARL